MLTARIFDIERFGLVDGPGIRTVIFFKGCPLRCQWCHNPESQSNQFEIMFSEDRCVRCGACKDVCPNGAIDYDTESKSRVYRSEKCTFCGRCAEACPRKAIELIGYDSQLNLLINEIVRGSPFYRRSKGGVTLSGGEPLLQPNLCRELLRLCRAEGIHTALDTSGYASWSDLCEVLPYTDLFLYDIKHMDDQKHKEGTGVSNALILDNLKKLVSVQDNGMFEIRIRIPVIPGFNANRNEIKDILVFVKSLGRIRDIEILPFHSYGISKYKKLKKECRFENTQGPAKDLLEEIKEIGQKEGLAIFLGI